MSDPNQNPNEQREYKIHPIALMFPRPTPDEFASLKSSIRDIGFRAPVTTWAAPDGHEYIIDGATRIDIRDELRREGVTTAKNGAFLEPEYRPFVGTEREALEHCAALILRRDLTPSQKAGVAIKTGGMMRQLDAKGRGEDPLTLKAEPSGELAERVARLSGVNKTYIYDMAAIHETNPDITDRVVNGILTIPQAKQVVKRRSQGLPDFEPKDGDPKPTEVPVAPKPVSVLDALGNPVHPDHAEAFSARKEVARIRLAAAKLLKDAQAVADGPGGSGMTLRALKSDINNFRAHLDNHQPHIVCPLCTGSGQKFGGQPGEKCATCGGRRYLDKLQYAELSEKMRAKLENREPVEDATPAGQTAALQATEQPDADKTANPKTKRKSKAKDAPAAVPAPVEAAPPADPDATATREFAPGELTPSEWDTDAAEALGDLPDVTTPAGVPDAAGVPDVAEMAPPVTTDAERDPFDM